MMKHIKIGDEITTTILNSVQKTITANLLSGEEPNFAACKAVTTRLSNYVAACEQLFEEQKKATQPVNEVDALKSQLAEMAAKLEELTKPKASKPKAQPKPKSKPKANKPKASTPKGKLDTETGYPTKGGRKLAAKAGQRRKPKNVVLEAQQQIAFVSALPTV